MSHQSASIATPAPSPVLRCIQTCVQQQGNVPHSQVPPSFGGGPAIGVPVGWDRAPTGINFACCDDDYSKSDHYTLTGRMKSAVTHSVLDGNHRGHDSDSDSETECQRRRRCGNRSDSDSDSDSDSEIECQRRRRCVRRRASSDSDSDSKSDSDSDSDRERNRRRRSASPCKEKSDSEDEQSSVEVPSPVRKTVRKRRIVRKKKAPKQKRCSETKPSVCASENCSEDSSIDASELGDLAKEILRMAGEKSVKNGRSAASSRRIRHSEIANRH